MGGFSLAYGVGDGGYRNLGLQFGVVVTRRERNLRTRRPDSGRDHHGGKEEGMSAEVLSQAGETGGRRSEKR